LQPRIAKTEGKMLGLFCVVCHDKQNRAISLLVLDESGKRKTKAEILSDSVGMTNAALRTEIAAPAAPIVDRR